MNKWDRRVETELAVIVAVQPADYDADIDPDLGRHIARHDPQRVLAECAAKRAIVEPYAADQAKAYARREAPWGPMGPYATMLALARVWCDHPDFDPAWLVTE